MKQLIKPRAALLIIATSFLAPVAGAVQGNGLSAFPTSPSTMADTGSAWFHYRLAPNTSQLDSITIANDSATTKRVVIYPVDATATRSGALAMRNKSEPRQDIGAWITLSASSLTLKPFEHRIMAFSIAIPPNTPVGDHVGGIIIQDEDPSPATTKQGVNIRVVSRLGVRVYETVPGTPRPGLEIKDFVSRPSARMHFTITLKNAGNVTIQPTGAVALSGIFGLLNDKLNLPPVTLLPGRTATIELTASRRHFFASIGQAKLELRYGQTLARRTELYAWFNKTAILAITAIFVLSIIIFKTFQSNFISLLYSNKKTQKRGDDENTNRRR